MSLQNFSIFSFGSHFVQESGTILAISLKAHKRNILVKFFFETGPLAQEEMLLKGFSIFSTGSQFV